MADRLQIIERVARPHWYDILRLIKRSQGLSVGELSEALEMSYMGIKKHCLAMQKLGYLDTWRRPKEVGRPEKAYRITEKAVALFPGVGDEVVIELLEAATQFEPNAAEKLLFAFYRHRIQSWSQQMSGQSIPARASELAALREQEGYFATAKESESGQIWIEEYHNPLHAIFEKYPTMERLEQQLFEKLLSATVTRSVSTAAGLTCYRFDIEA
ncbi:MAG: hypothetical protein AAF236_10515 [Verrucomicrobiota bacterium]